MLKSLLMASALTMAFSGVAMAEDAPSSGSAGCTSCALPANNAMVQVQTQQAPGRSFAAKGDGDQTDIKRMCCPPIMDESYDPYFGYNQLPGENMTTSFGLNYNPSAAFKTQMGLWSDFAMNAYAVPGWTPLGVAMRGDMRTDVPQNGAVVAAWPPTAADWAAAGSAGDVHTGWNWLSYWPAGPDFHFSSTFHDGSGYTNSPNPNHMEPNGRRYMMAISYYILERQGHQGPYRFRKIECGDGLKNTRFNSGNLKLAPGAKPTLESSTIRGRVQTPATITTDQNTVKALQAGRPLVRIEIPRD